MNSGHNFLKLTDDLVIGQLVPGIVVALIDQNCARLVAKSDSVQIVQYIAHHAATEASGYYRKWRKSCCSLIVPTRDAGAAGQQDSPFCWLRLCILRLEREYRILESVWIQILRSRERGEH